MNSNTIRSARKEGRHDNDGAQTEVAVSDESEELKRRADSWVTGQPPKLPPFLTFY